MRHTCLFMCTSVLRRLEEETEQARCNWQLWLRGRTLYLYACELSGKEQKGKMLPIVHTHTHTHTHTRKDGKRLPLIFTRVLSPKTLKRCTTKYYTHIHNTYLYNITRLNYIPRVLTPLASASTRTHTRRRESTALQYYTTSVRVYVYYIVLPSFRYIIVLRGVLIIIIITFRVDESRCTASARASHAVVSESQKWPRESITTITIIIITASHVT